MPMTRHGGIALYFETFGDRSDPALLLINGLGSQCINYRLEWCEKFAADGFFVIRFDNRDVGRSSKLAGVRPDIGGVVAALARGDQPSVPYLLADMAGDAVAVLDAVQADRAHVMGVSMGGMIAQVLAIRHSRRLRSIVSVMSTTGDPDVGQPSDEARRLIMSRPPQSREDYIARQLLCARTWGSPACYDERRIAANAAEAFDRCFDPEGQARQTMAIVASGSRTADLGRVRLPALVVHGDADKLVDPSGGRRTAEAIPGARFVLVEGMGHDYPPEYWDRLVGLVADHARGADA